MGFEKIYIQKESSEAEVKETIEDFDIFCKEIPFIVYSEPKDLPVNDWYDQDGDEVFTPEKGLYLKSYDMEVEFAYKGAKGAGSVAVKEFLDYLLGKDGSGAMMKMFCTYTNIGRKGIRVKNIGDDAEFDSTPDYDLVIFKVTFSVSDPVTEIHLTEEDGIYNLQ